LISFPMVNCSDLRRLVKQDLDQLWKMPKGDR
jgi:hypothetical protein